MSVWSEIKGNKKELEFCSLVSFLSSLESVNAIQIKIKNKWSHTKNLKFEKIKKETRLSAFIIIMKNKTKCGQTALNLMEIYGEKGFKGDNLLDPFRVDFSI